jgi:hypothetical protein
MIVAAPGDVAMSASTALTDGVIAISFVVEVPRSGIQVAPLDSVNRIP